MRNGARSKLIEKNHLKIHVEYHINRSKNIKNSTNINITNALIT